MARQLVQLYNWWPGSYYSSTTIGQAAITALQLVARQLLQLNNWWPGSYYSSTTGGQAQAAITALQRWPGSYYSSTTCGQAAITALQLVARQLLQLYNWWPGQMRCGGGWDRKKDLGKFFKVLYYSRRI